MILLGHRQIFQGENCIDEKVVHVRAKNMKMERLYGWAKGFTRRLRTSFNLLLYSYIQQHNAELKHTLQRIKTPSQRFQHGAQAAKARRRVHRSSKSVRYTA
ncbi:hypothetical protein E4U35_005499 [Claviceps purpurea]|nr:hypothetical protein E4U38_006099 [Claviceps purpurea]KAG6127816.1 hypothetical protein E4U12_005637 [Claviceps purpurea]KAG6162729.1 hypothetical protein E4U51_006214 [Claviceps purpurea]KAG6184996.1 hypothetical protein E4U10_006201 [Claviceps purpurea]KAG6201992.1 hypothetical protein E4U35_005499 [Claviceps purpurea]